MKNELLSVRELQVSFGGGAANAVNRISFSLYESEILAIIGESGSGKTVTSRSILSLFPDSDKIRISGRVDFCGREISGLSEKELRSVRGNGISLIPQNSTSGLDPTMRIGRQVCEGIRYHQKIPYPEARQKALRIFERLDLKPAEAVFNSFPHTLSGGQCQRVMIAMAVICEPKVIVADEPTAALDELTKREVLDYFVGLRDRDNISVLLITHDLRDLPQIADRVLIMYAGEFVEAGYASDVFADPKHPYTSGLLSSLPERQSSRKQEIDTIPGFARQKNECRDRCAFSERCGRVMDICREKAPPFFAFPDGRSCKCWLYAHREELP